jgi:pimeloyl-ACP methyl ester carboxylesterase
MSTDSTSPDTIVLIHGMWMTPLSWEHWIARYTDRGHRVLAPAWPGLDTEPEQLRRDPSPLRGLGIKEVVDHYDTIIRGLDRPPIIIGHSFGGLFTQLLLDRGLGAAGMAIGTAAPKGVLRLPYSTLRAAWPALRNPANLKKETPLNPKQFHWCFTNALGRDDSDAVYERYYIPGAARPFFQAGLANFNPNAVTKVDYREPASGAAAAHHRQRGPHLPAIREHVEFQGAEEGTVPHRAQGVRRALSLPGAGRLGGGRRLRAGLDREPRDRAARDVHRS